MVSIPEAGPDFSLDVQGADDAEDLVRLDGGQGLVQASGDAAGPVGLTRQDSRHGPGIG